MPSCGEGCALAVISLREAREGVRGKGSEGMGVEGREGEGSSESEEELRKEGEPGAQNGEIDGGGNTSLLPRPKPLTTLPLSLRGNGGAGPEGGPAVRGRGSEGRIANWLR